MRRVSAISLTFVVLTALVGAAVPIGGQPPQAQQPPRIKISTASVPVYVTVTDAQKRLVPDLLQDDFEILDNGKPQVVSVFENKPTPITTTVMIDSSGSMTTALDLVKAGAEQFLIRLLPDDKAQVGEFNDKIRFHPGSFIDDRDRLVYLLKNELDFGYPTRLWDAVDESIDRLAPMDGRKVVLVFTDGDDTASKIGLGSVIDRARAEEVMIYAIGLESNYMGPNGRMVRTRPDRGLRKISDETGGGYFELEKSADLAPTFTKVAQELHSQYVLGFTPPQLDGRVHKLAVKMKQTGLTARARRSYLAAADKTTAGDRLEK